MACCPLAQSVIFGHSSIKHSYAEIGIEGRTVREFNLNLCFLRCHSHQRGKLSQSRHFSCYSQEGKLGDITYYFATNSQRKETEAFNGDAPIQIRSDVERTEITLESF